MTTQETKVPAAVGPYRAAVEADGWIFISGQLPLAPASGAVVATDIRAATRQALQNLGAVLASVGLTPRAVVKTTIYLTDLAHFAAVNAVYAEFFAAPYPARVCVQVAALPKNAPLEIDAIATRKEIT
jgi:2-iminobutanoate/2-iminopropanoate deaminase